MKKITACFALFLALSGAPKAAFAEQSPFTLIAGDVLQITVWKEEGLDREVLVLPDGSITFPLIGSILAQGKTIPELQDVLKEKLTPMIPDASVSISVKAALGHSVSVIGQVAKPGELLINRQLTAMQALSQAGGLTPYAKESGIIILRKDGDKKTTIEVPYDDIASGDDPEKDVTLHPGDVIVVPTAGLF